MAGRKKVAEMTPEEKAEYDAAKANRKPVKRLPAACVPLVRMALNKFMVEVQNAPEHPLVDKAATIELVNRAITHFTDTTIAAA